MEFLSNELNLSLVGFIFTVLGTVITIVSVWYAVKQNQKLTTLERNEKIALWTNLDRNIRLLNAIKSLVDSSEFKQGEFNSEHMFAITIVYKGLSDNTVRLIETIIRKYPNSSKETIDKWREEGKIKSDWSYNLFISLSKVD